MPDMRQNPGIREFFLFFCLRFFFFAIWAGAGFLLSCLGGGEGVFVFLLSGRAGERACFCLAVWTGR